jgi:hypothetical protein
MDKIRNETLRIIVEFKVRYYSEETQEEDECIRMKLGIKSYCKS